MFDKAIMMQAFVDRIPKVDVHAVLKLIPAEDRANLVDNELERKHMRLMSLIVIGGTVALSAVAAITRRPELVTAFAPKA